MRALNNLLSIYAATFKDRVPIGFLSTKNFNYLLNFNNGSATVKPTQMWLMVIGGIVKDPKCYFCPSLLEDPLYGYLPNPPGGFSTNPWPFRPDKAPLGHTRLGYGTRPVTNWPADFSSSDK